MKLTRFDVQKYLDSEEAIEEFLVAVREENFPGLMDVALKDVAVARERLKAAKPAGKPAD